MTEQERFDAAVRAIALEDGVESLLAIPGVWECVSESLNNVAIARMGAGEANDD